MLTNPENYLKSCIAKNIVSLLLEENGFVVMSMGGRSISERLLQTGVNNNKIAKLLFNTPDFVIVNKKKEPIFLSIRYKGHKKSGRNISWGCKQLYEYWPDSLMMIVSNHDPFFMITDGNDFVPLEKSVLKINKKMSERYAHLAKKFLLN